ncbi:hypothetical protein PR048_021250 [Dryococelus australis]|uniref:Uncharacterized protein n=1 Tax=Dryococelus australis TaxID=614101 RepID=A0ABQ9GXS9_9NEOP|nr:hypothetical protein PR048_021250 [Dryococelus australis]
MSSPSRKKNIYNFDGTNLTDDPGRKKRGCEYLEIILYSTKSSTTVILCAMPRGKQFHSTPHKRHDIYGLPGLKRTHRMPMQLDQIRMEGPSIVQTMVFLSSPTYHEKKNKKGPKILLGETLTSHLSGIVSR